MNLFRKPKVGDFVLLDSEGGSWIHPVQREILAVSLNGRFIKISGIIGANYWAHKRHIVSYITKEDSNV